jgi:hypothetical protein
MSGTAVVIPLNIKGRNNIILNGALTGVTGFSLTNLDANPANAEYPHEGKDYYIQNKTGHDVTLKNFDTTVDIPFVLKNGADLVVPNNGIVFFKNNSYTLVEYFKNWSENSISGTENKLPKFSSSGITDSVIKNIDKKIGINKEIPESILDVSLPPPVETPLTGTFSFNGFSITGVNTLMLSELSNEATIKVVSTGNTYDLDMIMSDTLAYASSGGDLFTDEACVVVISETKYFDFMELLKSYVQFGNTTRENNEKVVYNKSERIYNESTGSIQQETNLTSGNSSSHSFRVNGTLAANIYILEEGGLLGITVRNAIGHGITYFSNNTIKITGLPTSVPQAGSNILYKDSNGFLKIA